MVDANWSSARARASTSAPTWPPTDAGRRHGVLCTLCGMAVCTAWFPTKQGNQIVQRRLCPSILGQSRRRGSREGGVALRTRRLSAPSFRTSGPSTVGFSSSSQPRAGAGAAAGAQPEAADGAAGTAAAWAVLISTEQRGGADESCEAVCGQVPAQAQAADTACAHG